MNDRIHALPDEDGSEQMDVQLPTSDVASSQNAPDIVHPAGRNELLQNEASGGDLGSNKTESSLSSALDVTVNEVNGNSPNVYATATSSPPNPLPRGRRKALTAEQRSHAALMRVLGACLNCKTRKEKCDTETPCKPCLDHFKGDLASYPCR